jgi:hypothetical protein
MLMVVSPFSSDFDLPPLGRPGRLRSMSTQSSSLPNVVQRRQGRCLSLSGRYTRVPTEIASHQIVAIVIMDPVPQRGAIAAR